MTLKAVRGGLGGVRADLLVLPRVEGQREALRGLGRFTSSLARRMSQTRFAARADEVLTHPGGGAVGAIALVGLGRAPLATEAWRRAGARARQEAERQGARRVSAHLGVEPVALETVAAFAEGFLLAGYRFDRYKSEPGPRPTVSSLTLLGERMPPPAATRRALAEVEATADQVCRARDVINEPASAMTPRVLAAHAARLASELPSLTVEIWNPKRIAREKLAGLLAVARGSREEPRFIKLRHVVRGAAQRVALVGKGITFDSGGLSLKTGKGMETQKRDMAGGATVLAATAAAAALGLGVDVTAYVPATENLPGGSAQKPGDVIRYLNGKTVEVLNTDAEGRLVLADALALASRTKPTVMIDVATLTGSIVVALGPLVAGVMGNDQTLVDALRTAGQRAGEPLWQMPLVPEYRENLKSPVADLRNVASNGDAGAVFAGLFLEQFVGGVPWAHLDIAGPAFLESGASYRPRGATAFGVRLLVDYLRSLAAH
jgi:leucyl aminopeptidase